MLPRVLFVEDDEVIREVYAMKFELEGFPTAVAENGQIALKVVEEFQPQVILLDMMMPVMNGLEFMQHLSRTKQDLPEIIVFSNISVSSQQMEDALRLGAKEYWIKSDYTPERVTSEIAKRWGEKVGT